MHRADMSCGAEGGQGGSHHMLAMAAAADSATHAGYTTARDRNWASCMFGRVRRRTLAFISDIA